MTEIKRPLAQMQQQVREVNEANGWFDSLRTFGEDIALLHSEASEMLEAFREHGVEQYGTVKYPASTGAAPEAEAILSRFDDIEMVRGEPMRNPHTGQEIPPLSEQEIDYLATLGMYKPEGVGSEAADVLIRLLDTCERYGIDLDHEFERKIAFNATRGHRHGGKRL